MIASSAQLSTFLPAQSRLTRISTPPKASRAAATILRGASSATSFVANINYDAKGQRQRIDYKNGASTLYSYDPLTFRLTQLVTRRNAAAIGCSGHREAAILEGNAQKVLAPHPDVEPRRLVDHIGEAHLAQRVFVLVE